ncbi:unnamed protein product [Cunninghamella blakesleeana]
MDYTPASYIKISPKIMADRKLQEQRLHTVVNALSSLGGLFSLFFTIQTLLLSFRPSSPWGLIHHLTFGELKRSISNGLVSKFQAINTPIPFVNQVHPPFSTTNIKDYGCQSNQPLHNYSANTFDTNTNGHGYTPDYANHKEMSEKGLLTRIEYGEDRMSHVENRLQLIESIFKSYYIKDDIFQSLDYAIKMEQGNNECNFYNPPENNHPNLADTTQNNDSISDGLKNTQPLPSSPPNNSNNV